MCDKIVVADDSYLLNCNSINSEEDSVSLEVCDREWLYLKLTGITKQKFVDIINSRSTEYLRAVIESIDIEMPQDIRFSEMDIRLYRKRWLMLLCVIMSFTLVNLQWFQFTIVAHTIIAYYQTSAEFVNWTSLIFMLCYVLFTFQVSYLLDNRIVNLRLAIIICSVLLFTGACIKWLSVTSLSFGIAFFGQLLTALAQVIIVNIPSKLAFEWFAVDEKTTICNLSIFGMQLGMLLGFAITPAIVQYHENPLDIANDLNRINYLHIGLTSFQLILVICVFRARPDAPPGYLQAIQENSRCSNPIFWETLKVLLKSCDFNLLNITFGIQMGVINTIFTLLNTIIVNYLPNADKEAGYLGVTIISASLFSISMILVLRSHRDLKLMALAAAGLSTISLALFVIGLLTASQGLLYTAAIFLGLFVTAFQTIGLEFAFEITFPQSDGVVGGILNVTAQLSSILITTMITAVYSFSHLAGNLLLIGMLFFSICCLCFANCELRRFSAYQRIDRTAKQLQSVEKYHFVPRIDQEKTPLLL